MNPSAVRSGVRPRVLLLLLWGVGSAIGVLLASTISLHARGGQSTEERLAGSCTHAMSEYAVELAERTFHGGVPYYQEEAFQDHPFQILRGAVAQTGHRHLSGRECGEIMPWLWMSLRLDPMNVTNYLDTAYMLAKDLGMVDEAMDVLDEAQRNNPGSYLVYLGKSRIYAKADNRAMARKYCDRALALAADSGDEEVRIDKRELLSRRAILRELDGDVSGAIGDMQEIIALFPERELGQFRRRIAILASGAEPPDSATQRWQTIRSEEYHHLCAAEEAGKKGHEHNH